MKVVEKFNVNFIHGLCLDHHWFTAGTNADYQALFDICEDKPFSVELLEEIARTICDFTDGWEAVDIAGLILREGVVRYIDVE